MKKKIHGSLMVQGTASSVGKSLVVMGLCRILAKEKISVAPFKPQNMSNNAMVAVDGGEIGRAQAFQAMACGLPPSHHFNPILLKPLGNNMSQLVVQGVAQENITAKQYYARKKILLKKIRESYELLQKKYDVIMVEGAGSPAEVNLRKHDMANMGFASAVQCPVLLVGDIDRGGVIASLVGTHAVLSPSDRALIKGFLINKFRGDVSLLTSAIKFIERKTNWKNFGILPFFNRAHLFPDEDSLSFQSRQADNLPPRVMVFQTLHASQTDDLAPLQYVLNNNGYGLSIIQSKNQLNQASLDDVKLIVLLGSKNTVADLEFLRSQGFDKVIMNHYKKGGSILGLCGGYQILGEAILDPHDIENTGAGSQVKTQGVQGLGLLPMTTRLEKNKTLIYTRGQENIFGTTIDGYEIHAGVSDMTASSASKPTNHDAAYQPFMQTAQGASDGMVSPDKKIMGTYLHGLLHNHGFLIKLLSSLGINLSDTRSYQAELNNAMDDWADFLKQQIDIKKIHRLLQS